MVLQQAERQPVLFILEDLHWTDPSTLTGSFSSPAIPTTLQDSLMARLDRLVTAKGVAQLGAVIGRQFSYLLLQAISQLDDTTLQRELGRLVETELVYQRGIPPQATYIFKHALIQDAAYASLLKSTRQQLHQRIASVLPELSPDVVEMQPELLAHHYTEAGCHEQAVTYWQRAGERAVARSAQAEAAAHLTKGLEILAYSATTSEGIQQQIAMLTTLGAARMVTKGHGSLDVEYTYTRAMALCQQIGDSAQYFQVLHGLWLSSMARGELHIARMRGEQLWDLAESQHDLVLQVVACRALAPTLLYLGEITEAHAYAEHGMAQYNPDQHHILATRYGYDPGVICLSIAAILLWLLGYPDQARQKSQEALMLAETLSHPASRTFALFQTTACWQFLRDVTAVCTWADLLLTVTTEHGYAGWSPYGRV